jgi:ketosteroid isomerase-like protein
MNVSASSDVRIAAVLEYFRRVDSGDTSVTDLMTEDVQFFFPKFGVGYGKPAVAELARGLFESLASLRHDMDRMHILTSGDHVIVEGFESGVTRDGVVWPDPKRSEGRFCSVFEFEGTLIKRHHVYVDPDYTSSDRARFLWGDTVRMTRP